MLRLELALFWERFLANLFRFMQANHVDLDQSVEALRKEWAFLAPYDLPTAEIKDRSAVFVREVSVDQQSTEAYVKIYASQKHPFQRLLRQSRSQNEVRNLLFFRSIGIPTPQILAWGERRNAIGRVVQDFIITEAVKDTLQLDAFIQAVYPSQEDPTHRPPRIEIARQLGKWTRAMHDHNFIHEDLKWRNILARPQAGGADLYWIDCPKGAFKKSGASLDRKKLKDCATLDKLARIQCSKEERTEFIKAYLGDDATPPQVQKLCKDIEDYRRQRFDAKDDQQREDAKENK